MAARALASTQRCGQRDRLAQPLCERGAANSVARQKVVRSRSGWAGSIGEDASAVPHEAVLLTLFAAATPTPASPLCRAPSRRRFVSGACHHGDPISATRIHLLYPHRCTRAPHEAHACLPNPPPPFALLFSHTHTHTSHKEPFLFHTPARERETHTCNGQSLLLPEMMLILMSVRQQCCSRVCCSRGIHPDACVILSSSSRCSSYPVVPIRFCLHYRFFAPPCWLRPPLPRVQLELRHAVPLRAVPRCWRGCTGPRESRSSPASRHSAASPHPSPSPSAGTT